MTRKEILTGKNEVSTSRWCTNKVQPKLDKLGENANVLSVEILSNKSSKISQ